MITPNIRISEATTSPPSVFYKTMISPAAADLMVVRARPAVIRVARAGHDVRRSVLWEAPLYEYRKEFIGEGQLIFFLQAHQLPRSPFSRRQFQPRRQTTLPIPTAKARSNPLDETV